MEGTLRAESIVVELGGRRILDGVSLDVAVGETVALLGPSGCGKTTLLRAVAGLVEPAAGVVRFAGRDITRVPTNRRNFGMMFQDFALFPHLTVAGNVAFGLRGRTKAERGARVAALLRQVGLAGFEERHIEGLSGGERQRVALARALAPEPRLLMLDEPLASLDRRLRERLVGELRDALAALEIPAIYVTHDQFEAFAVADRVAIMNEGRIVRLGTPQEVFAEPRTEFVARFLGFENVVAARVVGGKAMFAGAAWDVEGGEGSHLLLLRPEGVSVAADSAAAVVRGVVRNVLFQGRTQRLSVEVENQVLQFEVPASVTLPAAGETTTLSVPRVQVLDAEPADRAAGTPAVG